MLLRAAAIAAILIAAPAHAASSWQPIFQHDEAGFTFQLGEGACIRGPIRVIEKGGKHRMKEVGPGEDQPPGCSRSWK